MCCDSGGSGTAPAATDNKFTDTLADIASKQESRAETVFQPLQDQAVADVQKFNSQDYKNQQVGKATADVGSAFGQARAAQDADAASMGINPADGAFSSMQRGLTLGQAGATAAAATGARERADTTAFNTLAGMSGEGDAELGQSIGAANAGGNLLLGGQRNNLAQEQMNNSGMGGIGSLIGAGLSIFSSPQAKTGIRKFGGGLKSLRAMPVKSFKYKPDAAQMAPPEAAASVRPGTRVGPMADDAAAAMGGDGQVIDQGNLLGTTVAAVQELDKKVDKLKGSK
jgi:hypothetical protein